MARGLSQAQLQEAIAHLDVVPEDLDLVKRAPSREVAENMLAELKLRVRKAYRRQVLKLHPDRNGGDEAKTELFKLLTEFATEFEKLQVTPAPRPQMQMMHPGVIYPGNASTTSSTINFHGGVRVVFVRMG